MSIPYKILIVDDHQDSADTLAMILELEGHTTAVAYGGAEAISMVGQFAPELVISDISMPLVNGYDVARAIRKMSVSHCPIIAALTALARPQDRQEALDAGFDHHLQKPMDPAQLDRILDSLARPR